MKNFLLIATTILLLVAASFGFFSAIEKTEPTIELTHEQFMVLYKNGYLKGAMTVMEVQSREAFDFAWVVDSVYISEMFFEK